jgi:hypothetical protein
MGFIKQRALDDVVDQDWEKFLKEMLERDELKGALEGIAKRATTLGIASLSLRQMEVVEDFIGRYQANLICNMCVNGNIGSALDYIEINDTGICPTCQYDKERLMRD